MVRKKQRQAPPARKWPETDLDSHPNDELEDQLAADIRAITAVEQELTRLAGPGNHAARWLRMLGRVLPDNARCAKAHRVDPLPHMKAERISQCRQETAKNIRAHAEEAKATLEWYRENPEERRDQLPPWLRSRAEALADLQVLLWRSSPEGRLAAMSAGLDSLRAVVEKQEAEGSPTAARLRQRYNACARMTDMTRRFLEAADPEEKARLKGELASLEAEEAKELEAMRQEAASAGPGGTPVALKPTPPSPLSGRWRVVTATRKSQPLAVAGGRGFIEFEGGGVGCFKVGNTRGEIDGRPDARDGHPSIEFTWEGQDGAEQRWGRGFAVLHGKELHGTIFVHKGCESGFVARRARVTNRPRG